MKACLKVEHRGRYYLSKVVRNFFAVSNLIELPLESGAMMKGCIQRRNDRREETLQGQIVWQNECSSLQGKWQGLRNAVDMQSWQGTDF